MLAKDIMCEKCGLEKGVSSQKLQITATRRGACQPAKVPTAQVLYGP